MEQPGERTALSLVDAKEGGVLRDQEQLAYALRRQGFGFADDGVLVAAAVARRATSG